MIPKIIQIVIMLCLCAFSVSAITTENLTNYWGFDNDPDAASTALDSVENEDGTVNGATVDTTNFKLGNASYAFDGTNDWIDFGTTNQIIPDGTGEFSVSRWIWLDTIPTSGNRYTTMGWRQASGSQFIMDFFNDGGTHKIDINFRGGTQGAFYTVDFNDFVGGWTHFVISYDGGSKGSANSYHLFINGTLYTTGKTLAGAGGASNQNSIGRDDAGPGNYLDGKVDDVSIWNRNLTAAEAADLYNDGDGFNPLAGATISQNTYEVTSAYANQTAWRVSTNETVFTRDETPTVTFNTTSVTNASISIYDLNFSSSIANNSDTLCATTDTTTHTCTLPNSENLTEGVQNIYISLEEAADSGISTSGALNISLDFNIQGLVNVDGTPFEGAYMNGIDYDTNESVSTAVSNATGFYTLFFQTAGNYTVTAMVYENTSVRPLAHGPIVI